MGLVVDLWEEGGWPGVLPGGGGDRPQPAGQASGALVGAWTLATVTGEEETWEPEEVPDGS